MDRPAPFRQILGRIAKIKYDTSTFNFRRWFCSKYCVEQLEFLHKEFSATPENYEQKVSEAREIAETSMFEISDLLNEFFAQIVEPNFGPIHSRQITPTVRTHFSVSSPELIEERLYLEQFGSKKFLREFYFDSYRPGMFHRDKDYGLASGSLNLWLPLTDVEGANSLWIGGKKSHGQDAEPVTVKHGECIFFDGANRWHGIVWNTSPITRVSFDIRFFPKV